MFYDLKHATNLLQSVFCYWNDIWVTCEQLILLMISAKLLSNSKKPMITFQKLLFWCKLFPVEWLQSIAISHKRVILPAVCKNFGLESESYRNISADIKSIIKITAKCCLLMQHTQNCKCFGKCSHGVKFRRVIL